MSSGAGRKGGRAPRKRVRTPLVPADEDRVSLASRRKNTKVAMMLVLSVPVVTSPTPHQDHLQQLQT